MNISNSLHKLDENHNFTGLGLDNCQGKLNQLDKLLSKMYSTPRYNNNSTGKIRKRKQQLKLPQIQIKQKKVRFQTENEVKGPAIQKIEEKTDVTLENETCNRQTNSGRDIILKSPTHLKMEMMIPLIKKY